MLFVKLSICLLREAVHDNVKVHEIDCFFYVFIYVQISFLSDIHKSIFLTSYKVQPYVSFIVVRLLKTV